MNRKALLYTLFFVALVGIFYLVVQKWIKRNDTISAVQPFAFVNQDGKLFTNKDVEGKVYVAEYFYTTCPGICKTMNRNMKLVYDALKDEKNFVILSHTSMPEVDSASVLKKYADSMNVNTDHWIFLTGRKDSLYTAARVSYTIDDATNNLKNIDDDFLHTQFWALVDEHGNVKHIYDGLKQSDAQRMIRKIKRMLK